MKKLNNLKFKVPFISFSLSLIFIILFVFLDYTIFRNQLDKVFMDNSCTKIDERENFFANEINNKKDILFSIRRNRFFPEYLNGEKDAIENLKSLFEEIIYANSTMMQIRFLDEKGIEKIRFDRDDFLSNNIEEIQELQDKSSRYYFTENIKNKEKIWFSNLDLNIEEQKIEYPFKGTFRVVLPVVKNDQFQGILIVNYFSEPYLDLFLNATIYDSILVDKDGFIISHYDKTKSWSRYQKEPFKIDHKYLVALNSNFVCTGDFALKKLILPFQDELYLILTLNETNQIAHKQLYEIRAYTIITLFLSLMLILSIVLYFIFRKFEQDELDIQILTKRQKKQDILLVQQSKMASMGEMLANIAHQWRQPLTVIALNTTHLEQKVNKQKADKKFILEYIKNVNNTLSNMSQTIEDFSQFFKPNKEKTIFDIGKTIDSALMILDKTLQENNITIIFSNTKNYEYRGYKNELLHVILNIISNSKDALEINNVQNATIEIKITQELKYYTITIKDNGKGIDPNILHKIYDPYFSTKFQKEGTGIGLYMSKIIIEDSLDGEITLENYDEGVLCKIKLPI